MTTPARRDQWPEVAAVVDRLHRLGHQPFNDYSDARSAAVAVWEGWTLVSVERSLWPADDILVFTRATDTAQNQWAAVSLYQDGFDWKSADEIERYVLLARPFTVEDADRLVLADCLPDLLDAVAARADGNCLSEWIFVGVDAAHHDGPERDATATLLGLGGCAEYTRLLGERLTMVRDMKAGVEAELREVQARRAARPRPPRVLP